MTPQAVKNSPTYDEIKADIAALPDTNKGKAFLRDYLETNGAEEFSRFVNKMTVLIQKGDIGMVKRTIAFVLHKNLSPTYNDFSDQERDALRTLPPGITRRTVLGGAAGLGLAGLMGVYARDKHIEMKEHDSESADYKNAKFDRGVGVGVAALSVMAAAIVASDIRLKNRIDVVAQAVEAYAKEVQQGAAR